MRTPLELAHAIRHLHAADSEIEGGRYVSAAMHMREAMCDLSWALYKMRVPNMERLERIYDRRDTDTK